MEYDGKNIVMKQSWTIGLTSANQVYKWIDEWTNGPQWMAYKYWKEHLNLPDDLETIETGCGYGKFSMLLGLSGARVTILDYNSETVENAGKIHNMVGLTPKVMHGDLLNPSEELLGKYDIVCSFGTYEHFSGQYRKMAINNSAALLKPGGMLFFTVPNKYAFFYRIAMSIRMKLGFMDEAFVEIPYTRKELLNISKEIGIEALQVESIYTLKKNFDHWIMMNVKSLSRKLFKKNEVAAPEVVPEIDIESCTIKPGTPQRLPNVTFFDKRFSSPLLFVGRKL